MVTNNSCDYSPTQFNIQTGGASGTLNSVAPAATSGVPVISQGASSQPVFGTALVAGGGTGDTSFTAFAPICGGTTTTGALQSASTGISTSNFVLTSNGSSSLPSFQVVSAAGAVTSFSPNSGGAQVPLFGSFNILGTGSITTVGSTNTETIQLTGLTNHNVLVGAGTATITKVSPSATSGVPFISQGASSDPTFGTAVVAGGGTGDTSFTAFAPICGGTTTTGALQSASTGIATSGFVLTSNGSSALPSFQAVAASGVTSLAGDSGSATPSAGVVNVHAHSTAGSSVTFSGAASTLSFNVTNASSSTYIGSLAGSAGTSQNCVGLGFQTMPAQSSCDRSTGIGVQSLQILSTGTDNTAVGYQALNSMTTNANSTAIGSLAGPSVNGSWDIYIGSLSGQNHSGTETQNIIIDSNGVTGDTTVIRIGDMPTSNATYTKCFIGGISGATVTGTAVLCSTSGQLGTIASSARFKEDIQDLPSSKITELRPVSFRYKKTNSEYEHDKSIHYGMIAEEVEQIMPELVTYDEEGKPLSIKYHEMYALLLAEIKYLKNELIDLKKKVA